MFECSIKNNVNYNKVSDANQRLLVSYIQTSHQVHFGGLFVCSLQI